MKKNILFVMILALCVSFNIVSYAGMSDIMGDAMGLNDFNVMSPQEGKWVNPSNGRIFFYQDFDKLKNTWVKYDGKYYYVDSNGQAKKSTTMTKKSVKYKFDSNGVATVSKNTKGNPEFPNAISITEKGLGGVDYNSQKSTTKQTTKQTTQQQTTKKTTSQKNTTVTKETVKQTETTKTQQNNKLSMSGTPKTWKQYNGNWYYYGSSGYLVDSTSLKIDGKYYLFDSSCKLITTVGRKEMNGDSYYVLNKNGELAIKQWVKVSSNAWVYAGATGKLKKSSKQDGYQLDKNGYWYE